MNRILAGMRGNPIYNCRGPFPSSGHRKILFKSVLLHQLPQLAVGDAGLVGLVVDGDERDVGTIALDEDGVGDDPCTAAFALGFRGDGEAHLAQVLAQRFTHERRLAQGIEEVAIVVLYRGIALRQLLQVAREVGCGINLTVH